MPEIAKFPGIAGEDLNRCERVTVLLTQDCEVSKKGCCTASSQWIFTDEIYGCTLVLMQREIEVLVCWKMLFFIGWLCMSRKKRLYHESKNFFISRKLYELHSKPFFTHKNFFCTYLSSLSAKNSHFHKPKAFLLHKPFLVAIQSNSFPPSAAHSHHP